MKVSLVLLIALSFVSCKSEPTTLTGLESSPQIPHYSLDVGNSDEVTDLTTVAERLEFINLSPAVSDKVSTLFHFAVLEDGDIILVDEITNNIVRINQRGEEIWQLTARDDDFRYFPNIEDCTFDFFNNRIVVSDDYGLFEFDFMGRPVDPIKKTKFDYHQMVVVSETDRVFSAQGLSNSIYVDKPKQLIWAADGAVKATYIENLPFAPRLHISGIPQFTRLGSSLIYQTTFRDTFYRIDLPNVTPEFTFRFNTGESLDEMMRDKRIRDKFGYMRDNGIPRPIVTAADEQRVLSVYKYKQEFYFIHLDRYSEEVLANHTVLRYGDQFCRVPLVYQNGHLAWIVPDYEVAHYQKLRNTDGQLSKDWKDELVRLDQKDNDKGSKTLLLLEF